jgi:hypothetical protein
MAAAAHHVGSSAVMFTAMEHLVSTSDTTVVASEIGGAAFCISICVWYICGGLKNRLCCEKQGLTLLPADYPGNGIFLFLSFSISLSLFSITMALSIMCWKST